MNIILSKLAEMMIKSGMYYVEMFVGFIEMDSDIQKDNLEIWVEPKLLTFHNSSIFRFTRGL